MIRKGCNIPLWKLHLKRFILGGEVHQLYSKKPSPEAEQFLAKCTDLDYESMKLEEQKAKRSLLDSNEPTKNTISKSEALRMFGGKSDVASKKNNVKRQIDYTQR